MNVMQHNHTCLHMDLEGTVWGLIPQGVASPVLSKDLEALFNSKSYRIVGLPVNYNLITQLYSLLIRRKTKAQLWVGSPKVCSAQNFEPLTILSCLSVLESHNNKHNCWHVLNTEMYNNFLLMSTLRSEGFSDLTAQIYNVHCLRPFFRFLGVNDINAPIELISHIGDPRWYINSNRPYRLSSIESYFGLSPKRQISSRDTLCQHRFKALVAVFELLPNDSILWGELMLHSKSKMKPLQGYKLLLGFLVRNWLTLLTSLEYFDPDKFFLKAESKSFYVRQFKD